MTSLSSMQRSAVHVEPNAFVDLGCRSEDRVQNTLGGNSANSTVAGGTPWLSQQHRQSSLGLAFCTRGQKSKIANCMSVTIWHMRCQQPHKLRERTTRSDKELSPGVFCHELDSLIRHLQQPPLRDRWTAYISRGIPQKV